MKNPRELLTSGVAGVLGTGIDVVVLVLLVKHQMSIPLATFIAALTGAVANFALNKYVAFRDRSPITLGQVARFDFVAVVGALLLAAAMKLTAESLGAPVLPAKLACAVVVFVIWTYPAQRRLVFARGAQVA